MHEIAPTKMVFRRWRDGEVIALMPEEPADPNGYLCQSYMRVGQHGAANYEHVIAKTVPVSRESVESDLLQLMDELKGIGYQIAWRDLCTPAMRRARWAEADRMSGRVVRWGKNRRTA